MRDNLDIFFHIPADFATAMGFDNNLAQLFRNHESIPFALETLIIPPFSTGNRPTTTSQPTTFLFLPIPPHQ